jgi:hypothetical protein
VLEHLKIFDLLSLLSSELLLISISFCIKYIFTIETSVYKNACSILGGVWILMWYGIWDREMEMDGIRWVIFKSVQLHMVVV